LPQRRSGSKIFAGTAFHRVPAPLHPWSAPQPAEVVSADHLSLSIQGGSKK